jgi:hypothetical protein
VVRAPDLAALPVCLRAVLALATVVAAFAFTS